MYKYIVIVFNNSETINFIYSILFIITIVLFARAFGKHLRHLSQVLDAPVSSSPKTVSPSQCSKTETVTTTSNIRNRYFIGLQDAVEQHMHNNPSCGCSVCTYVKLSKST